MIGEDRIEGLRERKKRETRAALAWAAVRLAVERGYANVPVEDIAAGAGVSPRTFNNYFSSKSEAIVARHVDRLQAITHELRARASTGDLWTAIAEAAVAEICGEDGAESHPQWLAGLKLMLSEPAVQAEFLRQSYLAEQDLAAAIAANVGGQPNSVYPHLAAAAVGATIRVSIEQWLQAARPLSLRRVMQDAFERMSWIADGSPKPSSVCNTSSTEAPSR